MEKPENVTENGEYIEPHSFEKDSEAVLFYSYLEQIEYIKYLESKITTHPREYNV